MKYALCAVMLVACGGSDTPANDAHTQPTATATETAPTATSTGNGTSSGKAPSADMSRGIAALQNGDYPTAKSAFEAAITANARDADAHHYLAVTLEKTNDKAGAEREYKAALAIKPDLAEAAANLGALYVDAQKWDEAIAVLKPEAQKRGDSSAVQFNLALA
ncbi:MAG TPA: tetratricopeptide repeat protein, partial [Polyangiaceae bacterium]